MLSARVQVEDALCALSLDISITPRLQYSWLGRARGCQTPSGARMSTATSYYWIVNALIKYLIIPPIRGPSEKIYNFSISGIISKQIVFQLNCCLVNILFLLWILNILRSIHMNVLFSLVEYVFWCIKMYVNDTSGAVDFLVPQVYVGKEIHVRSKTYFNLCRAPFFNINKFNFKSIKFREVFQHFNSFIQYCLDTLTILFC